MKEYIEKILHQEVRVAPYTNNDRLPLVYQSSYDIQVMIIGDQKALLVSPVEKLSLPVLRKHQHQMTVYTGLPCVLYMTYMNYYARDIMLEEGIPFVWAEHQIYLPFIGTMLEDHQRRDISACMQISYLTQKLLLTALYQGWQKVTVTRAAEILSVSKMSITRCFDELEALHVPYLKVRNRARSITADQDKKAMWEGIRDILRNPVIAYYAYKEEPDIPLPLCGISVLAHYSMLDEPAYPFFAITKKNLSSVDLSKNKLASADEIPGCIIQKLGYQITFENGMTVDPLTAVLSISEEEKSDPRVSMAIDEMLEKYVW